MDAVLGTAGHIDHGKKLPRCARIGRNQFVIVWMRKSAGALRNESGLCGPICQMDGAWGIIDMPGHERFVKTMVAGACRN